MNEAHLQEFSIMPSFSMQREGNNCCWTPTTVTLEASERREGPARSRCSLVSGLYRWWKAAALQVLQLLRLGRAMLQKPARWELHLRHSREHQSHRSFVSGELHWAQVPSWAIPGPSLPSSWRQQTPYLLLGTLPLKVYGWGQFHPKIRFLS